MGTPECVFFCTVMLSMKQIWDNTQETAYTDGRVIGWNENFFLGLPPAERLGVMLHEILHVAFTHMLRKGKRNHDKFNRACDYAINIIIIKAGFKLPSYALYDIKYVGMTAEQIYDLLPDEPEDEWDKNPQDLKAPLEGEDSAEAKKIQAEVDDILIQAVMQTKRGGDRAGKVPGEIERYVESLLSPKIPWYRVLRSFMTKMAKTDWTFRKFNRRFFPKHILPTQFSEKVCDIAVSVDSSGSVDDHQFAHFVCETQSIIKGMRPDLLTFIQFDTKIISNDPIKKLADLGKIHFTGRGGTDINPVMAWAAKKKPSVLIVFTDGYFTKSEIDPKVPVIWIIYDNEDFKADFGKIIHYEFDEEVSKAA